MNNITNIDILWVLLCAFMVFLMQIGFAMIETGTVRAKNTINVAMKNLADTIFSIVFFWLLGYGLMFGQSYNGLWGTTFFAISADNFQSATSFIFQVMFAGTAATIVSGAVAERVKFFGYVTMTIITVAIIYPIFGHWAWASDGWLASRGFIDFAGSTVVHSVGGWVGLAGALVLGPRLGRFRHGKLQQFAPSSYNFIVFGVFILWFAWFGFNAGSTLKFEPIIGKIILNTLLAGAFGGLGGFFLSLFLKERVGVEIFSFGIISGLVGITAGCHVVSSFDAAAIGAVSAALMITFDYLLMYRFKIDDPLSVVGIHGFSGVWGTVAVALFAPIEQLPNGRFEQLCIQLLGAGAAFFWAFSLGLLCFALIAHFGALRVSKKNEVLGLNVAEHNARLPWVETIESILRIMKTGNIAGKIYEERDTELGTVARFFNYLLEILRSKNIELSSSNVALKKQATIDPLTKILNRRGLKEKLTRISPHEGRLSIIVIDIDHFKRINDHFGHKKGDAVLAELASLIKGRIRDDDLFARWGGEEFVLVFHDSSQSGIKTIAEKTRAAVEQHQFPFDIQVTCSFGFACAKDHNDSFESLFERADQALYRAKEEGRNRVCFEP